VARVALFLILLLVVLFVWRALRHYAHRLFGPPLRRGPAPGPAEQEMVRDPVCGAWIDRRLALTARRGADPVAVCSDACRRELESPVSRP
jgi:hypothetical protein